MGTGIFPKNTTARVGICPFMPGSVDRGRFILSGFVFGQGFAPPRSASSALRGWAKRTLQGQTGSLSTVISEGQAFAKRGYQVDWFWNDPTKFAD